MVNILLLLVCLATLILWLIQEIVGRRQLQSALGWCAAHDRANTPEDLREQVVPRWWRTSYKVLLGLWFVWLAAVLMVRDGDFALALVVLTALAAVVSALDKFVFERRRKAFVDQGDVGVYLRYKVREDLDGLRGDFSSQLPVAENARAFFPVLLLVLLLRSFVMEPFQIPSSSMVPSLAVGDYILVNKFSYGLRLPVTNTRIFEVGEPERGDVIVFFPPHDNRYFIKRVIGLPGDEVRFNNRSLYINGEPVPQQVVAEIPPLNPEVQVVREQMDDSDHLVHYDLRINQRDRTFTVDPGHYFMVGDNRDNSADSRTWGQVPEERVVGRAFAIWMHWPSMGQLPSFDRVGRIR